MLKKVLVCKTGDASAAAVKLSCLATAFSVLFVMAENIKERLEAKFS